MLNAGSIDLAVEFPLELLGEKEEPNYVYPLKRSFYLAKIAEQMQKTPSLATFKPSWDSTRGHALRPVLVLENEVVKINIHVTLPVNAIKRYRLSPGRNCVRKGFLLKTLQVKDAKESLFEDKPTPIYNSLIAMDMVMIEHMKMIHSEMKRIPSLGEAIKLAKAWLIQRGFTTSIAFGLSGFQLSMALVLLAKQNVVESSMNELQIFKLLLTWLSQLQNGQIHSYAALTKLTEGIPEECKRDFASEVYKEAFPINLVEPIVGMNIFFDWTPEMISLVKYEAERSLFQMNNGNGKLESLFLMPDIAESKFDLVFDVDEFSWQPDVKANLSHYANQCVPEAARLKMLARKLNYALNTRCSSIFILASKADPSWSFDDLTIGKYKICLLLNRAEAQRIVELGPLATQEAEAKAFRVFWRELADLRRFADGTIREAVAWDHFSKKRHLVINEIVRFVLDKHFACRTIKSFDWSSVEKIADIAPSFTPIQSAFAHLQTVFKSLSGLALSITRCENLSPAGHYAMVNLPSPVKDEPGHGTQIFADGIPVLECLLYLETSSRWPTDYYGMLYAKQTFSAEICRLLQDEHGLHTSITPAFFDILIDGFIFRCRLFQPDEVMLMSKNLMDSSELDRIYNHQTKLSRALSALANENTFFGPTCRFMKRIVSAAMLSEQIPEAIVELLCAQVFLGKFSPSSLISGIVATMVLIQGINADQDMLIVDFTKDKNDDNMVEKQPEDPGTHIGIVFNEGDKPAFYWTTQYPLKPTYVQSLQTFLKEMQQTFNKTSALQLPQPHESFDIVIELNMDAFNGNITLTPAMKRQINRGALDIRFLRSLPGFSLIDRIAKDLSTVDGVYFDVHYDRYGPRQVGLVKVKGVDKDLKAIASQIQSKLGALVSSVDVVNGVVLVG